MALPTYDKSKRKSTNFQQLPKGAYVIKILSAKEENNKNKPGSHLKIAFDIAEGEYAGIYQNNFDSNTDENKKWPNDGIYRLTVPTDNCKPFIWDNWNSFFADLEDSNNGFVFTGDLKPLRGKLLGGKFHIEQSEYNGNIYDHTRLRWTCVAEDVRKGRAGKLPNDKLIGNGRSTSRTSAEENTSGFAPATEDDDIPPF